MSDEHATADHDRRGHPGAQRLALADRRARTARSCCRTTTSSRRWRSSTASACPSASCTPRAPARTASSRSPRTSRSSRRPTSSTASARQTPMFARFSTVAGELGSPDTLRDPRGFALKFYTQEGNYDLVGNNTPVFFVRDPSNFQDFIHSQKRRADTDRRDNNMQWDFWTLKPESAHQVTILMSDRGTPKTYRNMNGFGSHTFMWVNAGGERFWIKYHFKTDQGIENFTDDEAGDDGRRGPRLPPRRPVGRDQGRRRAVVDAEGPGHAVRRRAELPLQPVRPDEGLAARRLPGDRGRPDGARPQPGELLRRGRAGRVRAGEHGPGHRPVAGQDAARAAVQLPRHAPLPDRPELPAAADQPPAVPRPQLQQGRRDALREPRRPGLRAEHGRRPARRRDALRRATRRGTPTATWCAPPTRCAPRTTTSASPGTLVREVMSQTDRDHLVDEHPRPRRRPRRHGRDEAAHRRSTGPTWTRTSGPPSPSGLGVARRRRRPGSTEHGAGRASRAAGRV